MSYYVNPFSYKSMKKHTSTDSCMRQHWIDMDTVDQLLIGLGITITKAPVDWQLMDRPAEVVVP